MFSLFVKVGFLYDMGYVKKGLGFVYVFDYLFC